MPNLNRILQKRWYLMYWNTKECVHYKRYSWTSGVFKHLTNFCSLPQVPRDQPIKTLSNQLKKSGLEVISPKGYKIVLDMDMNSVCSVQVEVNYM